MILLGIPMKISQIDPDSSLGNIPPCFSYDFLTLLSISCLSLFLRAPGTLLGTEILESPRVNELFV
jgi:hypothetical protein